MEDENLDPTIDSIRFGMSMIMKVLKDCYPICPTEDLKQNVIDVTEKETRTLVKAELRYNQAHVIVNNITDEYPIPPDTDDGGEAILAYVDNLPAIFEAKMESFENDITDEMVKQHYLYQALKDMIKNLDEGKDIEFEFNKDGITMFPRMDPVTKMPLKDPVRNKICNHVYGKESILDLISSNPRTRCPVSGCTNKHFLKIEHLLDDKRAGQAIESVPEPDITERAPRRSRRNKSSANNAAASSQLDEVSPQATEPTTTKALAKESNASRNKKDNVVSSTSRKEPAGSGRSTRKGSGAAQNKKAAAAAKQNKEGRVTRSSGKETDNASTQSKDSSVTESPVRDSENVNESSSSSEPVSEFTGNSAQGVETPNSSAQLWDSNNATSQFWDAPGTSANFWDAAGPSSTFWDSSASAPQNWDSAGTSHNMYASGVGAGAMYGAGTSAQAMYGAGTSAQGMYGPATPGQNVNTASTCQNVSTSSAPGQPMNTPSTSGNLAEEEEFEFGGENFWW